MRFILTKKVFGYIILREKFKGSEFMDWEEFKEKAEELLKYLNTDIIFCFGEDYISYSIDSVEHKYTKNDFIVFKKQLSDYSMDGIAIHNGNTYEVILKQLNRKIEDYMDIRDFGLIVDSLNEITYEIDYMSDAMLYNILLKTDIKDIIIPVVSFFENDSEVLIFHGLEKSVLESLDLFELLKRALDSPYTMVLTHNSYMESSDVIDCINSYLFNFCYNFGHSYKILSNLKELFKKNNNNNFNNARCGKVYAPKLIYKQALVEQYHMAASSDDPLIQFIGYYHILEYFFEEVYKKELIRLVREEIIRPEFSVNNDNQLAKIIDKIGNKSSLYTFANEREALKLTLKDFVMLDKVIDKLTYYTSEYVDYYKDNKVPFSGGVKVDLISDDKEIFEKLANRIYETRTSIIHSKSNELKSENKKRFIYSPFKDSEALSKEIPLIKALAEEVIINSAESLIY